MFWFDPMYFLLALPGLLLTLFAQWKVRSAYSRYSQVRNAGNLTGEQAANYLLRQVGLAGTVGISGTPGQLTDHYDPRNRTLYLSEGVARTPSVASIGIVAHEIGHAVQHAQNFAPLNFRMAIVPVVSIGTGLGYVVFFIGFFLAAVTQLAPTVMWLGILLMSGTALFSLVTLPVELDASRRALDMLKQSAIVQPQELGGAKNVLSAAALTYIAAVASSVLSLLYYIMLAGRVSSRSR